MRIISGIYKGRRIHTAGNRTTRPTTDRVREAWASTLASLSPEGSFAGKRVLDAFAGSGALGLELLSRGAEACLFIEQDKKALAILRDNIRILGLSGSVAQVCMADSLSPRLPDLIRCREPFDMVILDPPYQLASSTIRELLVTLSRAGLLAQQGLVSYEHADTADEDMDGFVLDSPHNSLLLELVRKRNYGTIHLDYYRCCSQGRDGIIASDF